MNKKTVIAQLSFLALLAACVAASVPLVASVNRLLSAIAQQTIADAEEMTGLHISYTYMSPAILWNINVRGITISEAAPPPDVQYKQTINEMPIDMPDADMSPSPLVAIRRVTLSYSVMQLVKGNVDKAFRALIIDGVDIDLNDKRIETIRNALQYASIDSTTDSTTAAQDVLDTDNLIALANNMRAFTHRLNLAVMVKHIMLNYTDKWGSAAVGIDALSLRRTRQEPAIRFTAEGNASVALNPRVSAAPSKAKQPRNANASPMSTRFKADITLQADLDNSTALFRLRDTNAMPVALRSLNILTRYADKVITVETVQSPLPLAARCVIDVGEKTIDANVKTAELPLRRIISPSAPSLQGNKTLIAALDTAITMDTNVTLGMQSDSGLGYHSTGTIILPGTLTKSGEINAQYSIMGNDRYVRLSHIRANGAKCNIDGNLNFVFAPMRLDGTLDVKRVMLPNGTAVSAQLFFDPIAGNGQKGFAIFSPEVAIGDAALNALEVDVMPRKESVDFSAEIYDYSHAKNDDTGQTEPGAIRISGSYLMAEKSALASITVGQYYVDSLAALAGYSIVQPDVRIAGQAPDEEETGTAEHTPTGTMEVLSDWMFAGEAYVSADKGGLSYNVPYALVANTKKDNQAVYLSLDGNIDTVNVSQLDIAYGNHGANITAHVERARDLGGAFFTLDAASSAAAETTVPYHFSGSMTTDNGAQLITVSDEYGSVLQTSLHGGIVEGNLAMHEFPIRLGKGFLSLTTETGFAWTQADGPAVHVGRFEIEGGAGSGGSAIGGSVAPRFAMSGEVSKYGAFFDYVSYSDSFSALDGSATAFLNMEGGIFDSARLDVNLSSPISGESIVLSSEITNPDQKPLTIRNMKENFYMNASLALHSFATSRFVTEHSENNTLTATLDATGTIDNPYISLDITRASMMFASIPIVASGKVLVLDKVLSVADAKVRYGEVNITDVGADFSINTFTGNAKAMLDIGVDKSLFSMPITFEVMDTDISPSTGLPSSFTVVMATEGAKGSFIKDKFPFDVTVMRSENETAIFTSDNLGISGYLVDGGDVNITSDSENLAFHLTGKNDWENLDLKIDDIKIDVASFVSRFNNDKFAMYRGVLTGGLDIGGIRSDPDFMGTLAIEDADFSLLKVVPYHITGRRVPMRAEHGQINIPEVALLDVDKTVFVNGRIMFDRWLFDNMELFVRTPQGKTAPALLNIGLATFDGDASIDLTVNIDRNKTMEVTGAVYVENTQANVKAREVMNLSDAAEKSDIFSRRIDVDITMGPHVGVTLDPILRAVLLPKSTVSFMMDEDTDTFSLKGDVGIKSGDIAWFNRSFYLKDGNIRFNDTEDNFDPLITLKAETRDRDDDGRDVKITMNAVNQRLSSFSPKFTSVPVKSENEIRAMLGQIAVGMPGDGDSSASDVMLSMGDFAVASTVGRAVENTIRDIFKFDIFSIRTNALQNVLKTSIDNSSNQSNNKITAGNLLDNSTVYIGKYIGSVIYLDAMLHLSYDEHQSDDIGSKNGILFQPEVGFELEAPFAGIRWSMAADTEAMKRNMFLPKTAVTLSWGFSF